MRWDLGLQGMVVLGAISLGFGMVSALLVVAMRYVTRPSHGDAHLWGHHSRPTGHT